jgi:CDGSH-type Zn-finger protein
MVDHPDADDPEPRASITPYPDGPLIVRGDFTLLTPDGATIDPGRRSVALCRCGRSAIKPFCDGTHKVVKFHAGTGEAHETKASRPETQCRSTLRGGGQIAAK